MVTAPTEAMPLPAASSYSGKRVPQLSGKFVLGDMSTGRLWWTDFKDMKSADDGIAKTMAPLHELQVRWNDPADSPDRGLQVYPTMVPIVAAAYRARGGTDPDLRGPPPSRALAASICGSRSIGAASCTS